MPVAQLDRAPDSGSEGRAFESPQAHFIFVSQKVIVMSDLSDEIEFDRMRSSDIDSVMSIEEKSFSSPWSREDFESSLDDGYIHHFVFRHKDELLAYIIFAIVHKSSHILNLAVHPDYRNKGIGTELLKKTLDYIRNRGVKKVVLEVREGNVAAQNLYSKLGFKVVGFRKGYYSDNENALVMSIEWKKDRLFRW